MTEAEFFFGRGIAGGGQVSDEEWARFLDEEITPRFPDGFTVQDASGQWKDANGITREASKRMTIVFSSDKQAALNAIREAYKRRFHQDSVLLSEQRVCAGF